jgi:hypothetical protein
MRVVHRTRGSLPGTGVPAARAFRLECEGRRRLTPSPGDWYIVH